MAADPNAPLTRRVLEEVIDERVPKIIDERVPKIIDERVPKIIDERLDSRLPSILGQFTEEVLLPAVQRIVHDEIVQSEHRLKVWVDERLADLRADIVLLTRKEDRKVLKIVDLLREKKILNDSEVQEILRMEPFAAQ